MQSRTETKQTIHIELTEKEAAWLRAYVQNYVGQGEEPTDEYDMRKALFDALTPNTSDHRCSPGASVTNTERNQAK